MTKMESQYIEYEIGKKVKILKFDFEIININKKKERVNANVMIEEIGEISETGPTVFEAFLKIREKTDEYGIKFLCSGARKDAWPSGMSNQMASGTVVYINSIGDKGGGIIDMFNPCKSCFISTVKEQRDYHRKWIASICQNIEPGKYRATEDEIKNNIPLDIYEKWKRGDL